MKTTAYCRLTAIQKSKGHSAAEKIKYIDRTGRYKNKPGFVAGGSGNLPNGFANFHQFWQLADKHERANSVTAREFMIDLPDHVSMKDALMIARTYANKITICTETDRPLPYSWAVHANEQGHGRHMHLVISERVIDGIEREPEQFFKRHNPKNPEKSGAPKLTNTASALKRRTERVKDYIQLVTNHVLEKAGIDMTVDFKRTVKEGKRPQIKLTPKQWSVMKSGNYEPGTSKKIDEFIAIDEHNRMIDKLREQQQILDEEIAIAEAEAEAQAEIESLELKPKPEPALTFEQQEALAIANNAKLLAELEAEYEREDEAARQAQAAPPEPEQQEKNNARWSGPEL